MQELNLVVITKIKINHFFFCQLAGNGGAGEGSGEGGGENQNK